jgi:hypothetical protein
MDDAVDLSRKHFKGTACDCRKRRRDHYPCSGILAQMVMRGADEENRVAA